VGIREVARKATRPWAIVLEVFTVVGGAAGIYAIPDPDVRRYFTLGTGVVLCAAFVLGLGVWLGMSSVPHTAPVPNPPHPIPVPPASHSPVPPAADNGKVAQRFITELHLRLFPKGKGLDRNHRVSLFTPLENNGTRRWKCIARTVTSPHDAAVWDEVSDKGQQGEGGLVSWVATEMATITVEGVPEAKRNDTAVTAKYLEQSCLSASVHQARSWPWASIAVCFARTQSGTQAGNISCVIVVERKDGEPIVPTNPTLPAVHGVCMWTLELAAELWRALKG
jgi:hypothetical protein